MLIIKDANRDVDAYMQGGTYIISLIYLNNEVRRKGLAVTIIKWLVDHGVRIRTDKMMTPLGKALWMKLLTLTNYNFVVEHNGIVMEKHT